MLIVLEQDDTVRSAIAAASASMALMSRVTSVLYQSVCHMPEPG
jgi:hypothetical protein